MTGTQLSFTLRTSTNVKTVHLLGSWDGYSGQLPLSRDTSGKAGAWKGHFRFQNSTLSPGKRYWYYYIMDGYHVSHDPAKPCTVEPTTKRKLNILDVPKSTTADVNGIVTGRGISPSRIVHPKPSKPYASRAVREADYSASPAVEEIASQLEKVSLYNVPYSVSPPSSVTSSMSSRSGGTSPSSLSSLSDTSSGSRCSCKRYGITRSGGKVLIDCGGSRCGYTDESSSSACSSSDSGSGSEIDSSDEEVQRPTHPPTRKIPPAAKKVPPATRPRAHTTASHRTGQTSRRR